MKSILVIIFLIFIKYSAFPQLPSKLKLVKDIKVTNVKDQNSTGTCWDFASISFVEAEALRQGKEELDLSEMFIVRYTYEQKAKDFVRFGGKANFGEGGQAHDVLNVIRKYGLVPQADYSGLKDGVKKHNHKEMLGILEELTTNLVFTDKKEKANWSDTIVGVIESYLGRIPLQVKMKDKTLSPSKYASEVVGFNPDNYVEISSYSHHPFYTKFALEVPDNWSHDLYWNLPIDDLMKVLDQSLDKGYTVCWDGDVSEEGFSQIKGLAQLSSKEESGTINAQMRQLTFDTGETTDDHLMHITGYALDEKGVKYYKTKNSWNFSSNAFGGYIYLSAAYVKLKTIAILVHKDVIDEAIKTKMK